MSIILGIDIASRNIGWAVIKNGKINKKQSGLIVINSNTNMGERLVEFENSIKDLINYINPDTIVIEDIYRGPSIITFKTLSLFRGVAIKSIYEKTSNMPISIMAVQARKLVGIKNTKEAAFDTINKKFKLKYEFKKHNDIVDAIVLGLAGYEMEKLNINEIKPKHKKRKRRKK
jgi:Holliday junction resolvasome RuvABC endonuclease subunit